MRRLLRVLTLTAVWMALWGSATWGHLLGGLVVALLVTVVFPVPPAGRTRLRPLAAVRFVVVFCSMLVASTIEVAIEVVRPRLALVEGIVAVPLHTADRVLVTLVANCISLTPGTLTVDVSDGTDDESGGLVLYVHALKLGPGSRSTVIGAVHRLEARAIAAFAAAEDRP
jgi:multicomponent Na+:H+ antiporter subunit E